MAWHSMAWHGTAYYGRGAKNIGFYENLVPSIFLPENLQKFFREIFKHGRQEARNFDFNVYSARLINC